ncbi:MAG: hypothetical protein HY894_01010, partial [Deltaproteobacteria bacterium]|nr:hypothetical protein [Deltaproteobacteria bacterium]
RPVAKGLDLDGAPCVKHTSALRNGFTAVNEKRLYQVQTRVNAKSVIVEENVDGRMVIKHKVESSRFEEITSRPKRPKTPIIYKTRKTDTATEPPLEETTHHAGLGHFHLGKKRTFLFWLDNSLHPP